MMVLPISAHFEIAPFHIAFRSQLKRKTSFCSMDSVVVVPPKDIRISGENKAITRFHFTGGRIYGRLKANTKLWIFLKTFDDTKSDIL